MAVSGDSIELSALSSLKRVDPYVKSILATATQVALYRFNHNLQPAPGGWEKLDKEGPLFIYSRNGEPFHSIMILNRLNNDNFIEPIVKGFEFQVNSVNIPNLMYKSRGKIYCIWFFKAEECSQVGSILESLMDSDRAIERSMQNDRLQNGQGNADIFSMLSRAQEDFNRTPSKPETMPALFSSSTPRAPDISSQSVMDFFAKASTKGPPQKQAASGGNVLQRLMSNPAHSVEHIEKQQRSITPQELVSYRGDSGGVVERSVPINLVSGVKKFDPFENQPNGFNIPSISPTKQTLGTSPLNYLIQNQSRPVQPDENIDDVGTSPFQQFLENASKPLLMTPMMFTAPASSKEVVSIKSGALDSTEECEPVEMLTEKQLAQALIYLLKNNKDFIKQIHQAYTNSILEKVDKPRDRNNL